ncbi:MAG TPA: M1 family metallopeptidase [Gemmatimonadales bacterium]|nr:M1 family metallopeptidase [Gemmatimonadales bacterium]
MRTKPDQIAWLLLIASVALFIGVRSAAAQDTYPRQPGIRITHYTFDVLLSDSTDEISMKEMVDIDLLQAGVSGINLDLCGPRPKGTPATEPGDPCVGRGGAGALSGQPNAGGTSGTTGMTVTAVTDGDRPVTFSQHGDVVRVTFASPSRAGQQMSLSLSYHGTPATGLRIANNKYGDRSFVSNDWPNLAHNWLATIDHIAMKAPKTMSITAPAKYQVISNGLLVQQLDLPNGMRQTTWDEKVPIPTWQFSLAAAPYAVDYFGEYHGIAMSSWVFPQEHANGLKGFGSFTQPILEFYIDHIGPFSYEKMAQVEANTVGGGMELASDIFYGYNGVPGRQLLAHEMAHQYFGNSVSESDWDDVWLSEGFATYFALLYQEYQDGHDAYLDGVQRSAASAIRYAESNPQSTIVHNHLANISQVIANNAQIYQGGAQVLHMLRGVVGTNAFWDGIRLYYSRFQNRNATSDDFRRAMQDACAASPDCPEDGKDLSWYFPQWLNRGGILHLNGSWHYDSAAKELHITLDQTQTQGLFRMPIEVGVSAATAAAGASNAAGSRGGGRGTGGAGAGGGRGGRGGAGAPAGPGGPLRIVVDKQHNEFTFPMPTEPADVILDPNHWVSMMQATFVRK